MNKVTEACHQLRSTVLRFCREDDGPTAAEYAVMLAVIIVAAIVGLSTFGDGVHGLYVEISDALTLA
jgi:pilus assembly protein Flp/PilA